MLSDRRQRVLAALIEEYVAHALPVGSNTLTRQYHLGVSSATVRNDLSALENEGYIYKIVGSGTFASNIKLKKKKPIEKKEGLIHFDSGNPSADMFPIDDYKKAIIWRLKMMGLLFLIMTKVRAL